MARNPGRAVTWSTVVVACVLLTAACADTRQPGAAAAGAAAAVATPSTAPRNGGVPTPPRGQAPSAVADDPRGGDVTPSRGASGADGAAPRIVTTPDHDASGGAAVPRGGTQAGGGIRTVERGLRPIVDRAVRDLSARLGVPTDRVTVVLARRVTWPDERLGCPRRGGGEAGLGGPRRGTQVHLRVHDLLYRYHTGGRRGDPFLCDPGALKAREHADRIEP